MGNEPASTIVTIGIADSKREQIVGGLLVRGDTGVSVAAIMQQVVRPCGTTSAAALAAANDRLRGEACGART